MVALSTLFAPHGEGTVLFGGSLPQLDHWPDTQADSAVRAAHRSDNIANSWEQTTREHSTTHLPAPELPLKRSDTLRYSPALALPPNEMFVLLNNLKRSSLSPRMHELHKLQTDLAIAPLVLLLTFYFSTFGLLFTFLFLFILLPISFYFMHAHVYRGNKINSCFYTSWTVSSFIILLYIFEFVVVPFLEITLWENYILLVLVSISTLIIIFIRYRSKHFLNIEDKPVRLLLYNQWIDANINVEHFKLYFVSLLSLACALLFGMYLSITTICHTNLQFDFLLVPDDCSEIYFDINLSLSFIAALYAGMLLLVISYSLGKLLYLFAKMNFHYNQVPSS